MIVTVRDPNILSNLDPQQITAYLQARGWQQESNFNAKDSVWFLILNTGEELDITLPLNQSIRAYALRMVEVLETLEKAEERSQLDILADLVTCIPNIEVQGIIIKLPDKNHMHASVTVMGFVVGKPHYIQVQLSKNEYQLAQLAYDERLPVICIGDLIKENETFILTKISKFVLYDHEEQRIAI
jgi:hypothetical protein